MPVLLVTLIVVAAWMLYPAARIQYVEARERARLEQELAGLQERNEDLQAQVDRLKTPEGVEEMARSDLGMVKEGENLYMVMDGTVPTQTSSPIASPEPLREPWWLRLLDFVFGMES